MGIRAFSVKFGGTNEVGGLLSASANVVFFCSAKENLDRSLFRPFRNEVYVTPSSKSRIKTASWWKRLTKSARDPSGPYLILDK